MKVLFLGSYNASFNALLSEFILIKGLIEKGVDITVMGTGNEDKKTMAFFKDNHIPFIEKDPKKYDKEFVAYLRNYVIENDFKIVYAFTGKYLRLAIPALKKTPVKLVTYYGSLSLHWHDISAYFTYLSPRVDKIICNSDFVYQHVKKQLFGKNKDKAVRIYKGYDSEWFKDVEAFDYSTLNIPSNATVVFTITRNDKVKDVPTFLKMIEYLQDLENVHFIMLGFEIDKEHYYDKIKHLKNKGNIHLLGYRYDAVNLLKPADIYVQNSLSEGLGRGLSEAAILGKPIVMTNADGCVELIEENVSGFIVDKKDAKSLAQYVERLIKNPDLRQKMGKAAVHHMDTKISIDETINLTYELFKELSNS